MANDWSGLVWHPVCSSQNLSKEIGRMKYRVHRFDIRMTSDQHKLEQFLNNLEGEVIAIVPNVTMGFFWAHRVDFLLIVEKLV